MKIEFSFLHTGTTTGRLSSKIQKFTKYSSWAFSDIQIRRAFIAQDGYKFVELGLFTN